MPTRRRVSPIQTLINRITGIGQAGARRRESNRQSRSIFRRVSLGGQGG